MDIKTFDDLIDWTRQLHGHLAQCLADSAGKHEDERARMLLDYLAAHEAEMGRVVGEFENRADHKALNTYLYDYLEHRPVKIYSSCDTDYASLPFEAISEEVFGLHDQVIDLYRSLVGKAEIPEAKELLESLLEFEQNEAKRLVHQTERMKDL